MPRKKKAGMRTNCQLCGTQVTVGNENRHAAFCDRRIETAAFVSTLTNSCITIPSSSNADVTNYTAIAGRTSDTAPIVCPGDDHVHDESSKKRYRSSSRIRDHTSFNEPDVDQNLHLFPSGGSNNSEDMMDITDYLPDFCNDDNDPTSQYISTIQDQQLTQIHYSQPANQEIAASYDTDSLIPEILNTHYPVSTNICPNLPSGGVGVLGVEAPTSILLRHQHDMAATTFRLLEDDTSETQANRTNVDVFVNTHKPVSLHDPWNELTTSSPILFPVDDAAYHTTTPLEKLSMMQMYRCVMDANCPRYFLDKFIWIIRDEITLNGFCLDSAPSRVAFVNYFTKKYPTAPPILRDVPLETDVTDVSKTSPEDYRRRIGDVAQVITFDFKSQLQDLLGDKQIWGDPENLLLNSQDHFAPYCNESGALDDVLDGSWYSSTVAALKIGKNSRQFLIPIIIYMDKTGTDANQRHSLEPVLFTLGVFSRKLRNQTRAWRILGFIPDLQLTSSAFKKSARSRLMGKGIGERNYHTCLGVVLHSFIECQLLAKEENGGLKAWLRIGDRVKAVNLVVPLCFVIGDAKSGDTLCGRFGGYNTKRMSRACHVSLKQCDDPNHQCRWANSRYFEELSRKATYLNSTIHATPTREDLRELKTIVKKLHSMSQHRHTSAFELVDFGSNTRGICGATPTDLMHAFLEGVLKYLLRIVIESIPENKKSQIDLLIGHMFGNIRNSEMNASTFLKSNFTHGYTNLTMLTADEWAGMTFALLIIIRSKCGQEIIMGGLQPAMAAVITKEERPVNDIAPISQNSHFQSISHSVEEENDDEQSNDDSDQDNDDAEVDNDVGSVDPVVLPLWELTEILERLLVFHAFYKRGSPYDWIDQEAQESRIRLMGRQLMDMVVRGMPRTDGNGWKIQKLHELLHMASDMTQFGCPQNYDAGPGESSLKTWAKFPARTALKQGAVIFSESVARRLHEIACFSRMERTESSYMDYAEALAQRKKDEANKCELDSDSDQSDDATVPRTMNVKSKLVGLPKFVVFLSDDYPQLVQSKWMGKQKQKKLVELHPLVLNWIRNEAILDPNHPERRIDGYTEYRRNGVRFRAHPNYRSSGAWHDFVMVAFSDDSDIPVRTDAVNAKLPPFFDPYAPPFGDQYYPCKILAFLSIPNKLDETIPNRVVAVVQSCETRSSLDAASDTRLLQVWTLEYDKKVNDVAPNYPINVDGLRRQPFKGGYRSPLVREVDVNCFDERVLVIEENPGNHEHLECKLNSIETVRSRRVFLVKDRDKSWAKHYLNWNSDQTRTYDFNKYKAGQKRKPHKKK